MRWQSFIWGQLSRRFSANTVGRVLTCTIPREVSGFRLVDIITLGVLLILVRRSCVILCHIESLHCMHIYLLRVVINFSFILTCSFMLPEVSNTRTILGSFVCTYLNCGRVTSDHVKEGLTTIHENNVKVYYLYMSVACKLESKFIVGNICNYKTCKKAFRFLSCQTL